MFWPIGFVRHRLHSTNFGHAYAYARTSNRILRRTSYGPQAARHASGLAPLLGCGYAHLCSAFRRAGPLPPLPTLRYMASCFICQTSSRHFASVISHYQNLSLRLPNHVPGHAQKIEIVLEKLGKWPTRSSGQKPTSNPLRISVTLR